MNLVHEETVKTAQGYSW